jgi:hypothetical protein
MASPLILPNGFSSDLKQVDLSREDVAAVLAFEQMCARHKLKFVLLCESCLYQNPKGSECKGDNAKTADEFKIACGCTKRTYRSTAAH